MWRNISFAFLTLFIGSIAGVYPGDFVVIDICTKSSIEKVLFNYTFESSVPKGGKHAGIPTKYKDIDEDQCYGKCCDDKMCNIAWHSHTICITFQCDFKDFDKCMPRTTQNKRLLHSKLLLLRYPSWPGSTTPVSVVTRNVEPDTSTPTLPIASTSNVKILEVMVSKNKTLTLPTNFVTLWAYVSEDKNNTFEYQWNLLSKPSDKNIGKMDTTKNKQLKLTDLIVGDYLFQVEVHGNNSYGKAVVSVIVKPAKKPNEPPLAKIEPNNQTIQLPNNVILDGSKSSDDDKIVSYNWELIKGPLDSTKTLKQDQSMLNLENLVPGNYTFKLIVKDAAGATSSDTAYLQVLPEKDFPPVADPGHNIIVELPVKYVILNGSNSRDDKKIMSYKWTKKSDDLTADMQGVREPVLNLTNLQEGTYTFNLMVTDVSGQVSDKDVQVFVKPRTNSRPVAKASISDDKSVTVRLPASEAILNGSLSSDDDKIIKYKWVQIEGEPKLNLVDANKAIAYVDDLKIGIFKFKLTVYDKEKLTSSDVVTLRINESKNQSPKARIADVSENYHLSDNLIKVDGSRSWDDIKIVQYKWDREDDSLAVGEVLDDSDSSPILMLTDLLPGVYKFKLQVFDAEGLFDSAVKEFQVKPSKHEVNLVELQFKCAIGIFTEAKKSAFINNIQLVVQKKVNSDTSRVVIHTKKVDINPLRDSVTMVFYVTLNKKSLTTSMNVLPSSAKVSVRSAINHENRSEETSILPEVVEEVFLDALVVVEALSVLRDNTISMEYQILRVDTYICQNNCSFHGRCDETTKLCECDTFWTSSFFRERFGDGRPNCDWSVIYLIIFFAMLTFLFLILCWFLVWTKQRRCKNKKTAKIRKHKYMKLNEYDLESRSGSTAKVPKSLSNGVKARMSSEKMADSLANSDSDISSEENTTFINTSSNLHRDVQSPIKKSSSFSSIPTSHSDPLKTL